MNMRHSLDFLAKSSFADVLSNLRTEFHWMKRKEGEGDYCNCSLRVLREMQYSS